MLRNSLFSLLGFVLLLAQAGAYAAAPAAGEVANADAQRKKPLQRCDQLSDKAELDCLNKARERIVEARKKRETASKGEVSSATGKNAVKEAPAGR